MNIQIVKVDFSEKEILRNLLEKYNYEFSQYDNCDINQFGLYGYSHFDHYWTEENRHPFFIKVDGNLAGFVMVNDYFEVRKDANYAMSEFFVMYKYRQSGVGRYAVKTILDMFHGKWELKRHPKNISSVFFWNKVIDEYTNGKYELIESCPQVVYDDGSLGDIFFFES